MRQDQTRARPQPEPILERRGQLADDPDSVMPHSQSNDRSAAHSEKEGADSPTPLRRQEHVRRIPQSEVFALDLIRRPSDDDMPGL